MPATSLALICLVVALMSAGQLLFKSVGSDFASTGLLGLLKNPLFYAAGFLYVATTFLWIFLLSRETISRAYPLTALIYVIVPLLGAYIYKEPFSLKMFVGILLIMLGVLIVGIK